MKKAFHPFPKLPLELRLMTWELSLRPRVIIWQDASLHLQKEEPENTFSKVLSGSVPELLHVNQETRAFCQSMYKPFLGHQFCYFNNDFDTLYLPDIELGKFFKFEKSPQVHNLALDPPVWKIEVEESNSEESDSEDSSPAENFEKLLELPIMTPKIITIIYQNPPAIVRRCGHRSFLKRHAGELYPDPMFKRNQHWAELQSVLADLEEDFVADGVPKERIPRFRSNLETSGDDPMMKVLGTLVDGNRGSSPEGSESEEDDEDRMDE